MNVFLNLKLKYLTHVLTNFLETFESINLRSTAAAAGAPDDDDDDFLISLQIIFLVLENQAQIMIFGIPQILSISKI